VLPGLLLVGLRAVHLDDRVNTDLWVSLLCLLLVLISLLRYRGLAVWTLPAAGLLITSGPGVLLDVLFPGAGQRPLPLFDTLVNILLAGGFLLAVYLIWHYRRQITMSRSAWIVIVFLFLTVVFQPGFLPLLSLFMGLPLALALPFLRRFGPAAGLLALGGIFMILDMIWDPSYYMPDGAATVVELILPTALLLLAPLWILRARTIQAQRIGLVLPPVLALGTCELIRLFRYPPGYTVDSGLVRGLGLLQICLLLLLASAIYTGSVEKTTTVRRAPSF
jgi:hypothetical protein